MNVAQLNSAGISSPECRGEQCPLWRCGAFLLLIATMLLTAPPLEAQQNAPRQPVGLRLEPLSIRGRSGGPIPVQIKLEYNQNQMIEGDLVLHVYNNVVMDDDRLATLRYEGIVLQGSDYIFNTVLPPIEHAFNRSYEIVAWFETDANRIPLSADADQLDPPAPHDLISLSPYERSTLICSVSGRANYLKAGANRAFLNKALSLVNYNPPESPERKERLKQRGVKANSDEVQNFAASWNAIELPEDPLHYCAFDLLILADGATGRLNEQQMNAIVQWVRCGGSVCVFPNEKRLTGRHLEFLQSLFERDDDPSLKLSLHDDSTLLVISDVNRPIVNRHVGYGRATLLPVVDDLAARFNQLEIAKVVSHLWKVRADSPINNGRQWDFFRADSARARDYLLAHGYSIQKQNDAYLITGPNYQRFSVPEVSQALDFIKPGNSIAPEPNPLGAACETGLMPDDIQMVPSWVIGVLLFAYVMTIGPLDYIVLGYFKARKFTWILFPVVTAAYTLMTIGIAHQYMSSTDTGGAVSVIDVDSDGTALRESTVQLYFFGSQTEMAGEATSQFVVPAEMANISAMAVNGGSAPKSTAPALTYHGRFPQKYGTTQSLRQWEPQSVRSLSFSPTADVPTIDWSDLSLVDSTEGRKRLSEQIRRLENGDRYDAIVLHENSIYPLYKDGILFSQAARLEVQRWVELDYWDRYNKSDLRPANLSFLSKGLVDSASSAGNYFFQVVSQVSPHGSASMEDLFLLDPSNENEWVLMVVRQDENEDFHVFRRLYRTKHPEVRSID